MRQQSLHVVVSAAVCMHAVAYRNNCDYYHYIIVNHFVLRCSCSCCCFDYGSLFLICICAVAYLEFKERGTWDLGDEGPQKLFFCKLIQRF